MATAPARRWVLLAIAVAAVLVVLRVAGSAVGGAPVTASATTTHVRPPATAAPAPLARVEVHPGTPLGDPGGVKLGIGGRLLIATSWSEGTVFGLDAGSGRQRWRRRISGPQDGPLGLLATRHEAFVYDFSSQAVLGLDPATGRVLERIAVPSQAGSMAIGAGALWLATGASAPASYIVRIDPETGRTVPIPLPVSSDDAVAVAGGSVWVLSDADGVLLRIDPATGRVRARVVVTTGGVNQPMLLAASADEVWVTSEDVGFGSGLGTEHRPALLAVNSAGRIVVRLALPQPAAGLTVSGDRVTVTDGIDRLVTVNTATGAVRALRTAAEPTALVAQGGRAWLASSAGLELVAL